MRVGTVTMQLDSKQLEQVLPTPLTENVHILYPHLQSVLLTNDNVYDEKRFHTLKTQLLSFKIKWKQTKEELLMSLTGKFQLYFILPYVSTTVLVLACLLSGLDILSLSDADIYELRTLDRPSRAVQMVLEAVCILFRRNNDETPVSNWQQLIKHRSQFLSMLLSYDKDSISDECLKNLKPYIDQEELQVHNIVTASLACVSIGRWVHAMYNYAMVRRQIEYQSRYMD
ncbi:unnamed protein product [Didymodactylos carnosus]|uniref:Dynein heavy chain coiled coil stalk domain-containing protein n=1 Tax=Didymodactylos carnosus TaxID=1234261 RepID=A0A815KVV3_9BILA|nr:unnamed protein product [Didymodactylos carnosus]CAF4290381.1 unnamed protein product [Didymodactylos carnosus]